MAKKVNKDSRYNSSRARRNGSSRKSNKGLIWALAGLGVIIIGGGLWWWVSRPEPDQIEGKNIPEFAKEQLSQDLHYEMPEQIDAYIDFSDGMQWAFDNNPGTKENIQAIVHKLVRASTFYKLKGGIETLGLKDATAIYNAITSPSSYLENKNLPAPIETALDSIVKRGRPAFLMTDFEEYKDGKIQEVSYARDNFTQWIKAGNDITFYIMDFVDGSVNSINKHLYYAVFDGGDHKLVKMIDDALQGRPNQPRKFVLSNDNFVMARTYDKNTKGGNYHDANGKDIVTVVDETGGDNSYKLIDGYVAEYYPLNGGSWAEILENAKALSPEALQGVEGAVPFEHIISDRFVNLSLNDGFTVEELDIKVTAVTGQYLKKYSEGYDGATEPVVIRDFLVLDQKEVTNSKEQPISVNFAPQFTGTFPDGIDPNGLFRVDILVGKTAENLEQLDADFKWSGNDSLLESIRNTLQSTNPEGTRLMTFYIHLMK